MKQEEWTQRLRDHLADYEVPVPDDLWEKIEARLPKEPVAKKPKARTIPLWVRWAAAAVFVGGIIGTGVVLWPSNQENAPVSAQQAPKQQEPQQLRSQQSEPQQQEPIQKQEPPTLLAERPAITTTTEPVAHQPETKLEEPETTVEKPKTTVQESETKVQEPEPKAQEQSETPKAQPDRQDVIRELDQKIAEYQQHRSRRAAINLYASNGFGNQSYRNGVLMSREMLAHYDYYTNPSATRSGGPVYLANHEERQKFYQPISFGLTVNIPISSGFSLSSGVVYTRLHSDFTSIANSLVYERQQTLHYVGIPLTMQYNVWQWHGLNVYAAVGGQADFNVKASVTTDGLETKLEKDDMQWSINAAVGVQYNIIPLLGVYVEPGIKHYFDNGSHIRNFFKYKPTNFNLQIGLRMNLGTD